jgi:hypothetical protein
MGGGDPVHDGHPDIHEQEIRLEGAAEGEDFLAIVSFLAAPCHKKDRL